ncbi:MAG: YihY/virulence factor BrkB family protein [Chloroflexi bacterium]|nr:YihY/virulence factor BrkB family protein [Chloroflexota bacterium]
MREVARRLQRLFQGWFYSLPAPPIIRSLIELTYRVFRNFSRDDGSHMAAGVAYYAIFSLFPLALATISIAGVFVSADDVQDVVLDFLRNQIGVGSEQLVTSNIEALLKARGAVGIAAFITMFWSSRAVFGAVHRVMNRAWKVSEPPRFIAYQLAQIGTAFGVAVMFMASATLGPAGRALASRTEYLFGLHMPWGILFTVLPLMLSALVFLMIYLVVPDAKARWRDAIPAAVLATVLFEFAKGGFAYYLSSLSSLDLVYGSVTTIVVLMIFLYMVAMVLVLGAELSSELNKSTRSGILIFRGHWKPVLGGFAPIEHRQLRASQSTQPEPITHAEPRHAAPMPPEHETTPDRVPELDLPSIPSRRDRPPGV